MKMRPDITAYLALGSNLGDRAANICAAVEKLNATSGIDVKAISALMENPAQGGPADSPLFLNAALEIETSLSAHQLLRQMLEIEHELGRQRREKWSPRIIDLDLLLYGDQVIDHDDLIVPHPLMQERMFVLKPLAEIAPDFLHPVLKKTIAAMLQALS